MTDRRPVLAQAPAGTPGDSTGGAGLPQGGPDGPGEPGGAVEAGGTAAGAFDRRLEELEQHRGRDVTRRLAGARRVEAAATAAGDLVAAMRARLVVADMLHRLGDATGIRLAVTVNDWATTHGVRPLLARSHLVLSGMLDRIGDAASALDHAVRGIALLDDDAPARVRGNHLLQLADVLDVAGSTDQARERYREAAAVFAALGDRERQLAVVNNLTVLECEAGHAEGARRAVAELLDLLGDEEPRPSVADTIARAHLVAGDLEEAQRAIDRGNRLWPMSVDVEPDTSAALALTGVETKLAMGRPDEAAAELDRCLEICAARGLGGVRVQALAVRATLLAARGDFEGAYRAHQEFHAEYVARHSRQQEAAARTRQALFETAEARQEAQHFWRQARTDPLTELYNRRFVDEELPRYLKEVAARGGCLAVGLVDADHFKLVNDRFSHAVGDQVLRRLAVRVSAVLAEGARHDGATTGGDHRDFAARLGGEEFLVVVARHVPADAPHGTLAAVTADAVRHLSALRADIAGQPWHEVAPHLTVTVSVGIAVARPTDTPATLLTRADGHLYRAKELGRDRVVADPPVPSWD